MPVCGASARPRTSPRPPSGSLDPRLRSLPAQICSSTAASLRRFAPAPSACLTSRHNPSLGTAAIGWPRLGVRLRGGGALADVEQLLVEAADSAVPVDEVDRESNDIVAQHARGDASVDPIQ